ncbi:hypothetical protein Pmani_021006, partial [Petrolisthes manimaculis]
DVARTPKLLHEITYGMSQGRVEEAATSPSGSGGKVVVTGEAAVFMTVTCYFSPTDVHEHI